ncbi:MAG: 4-hydroxythreonine-4-phosphate dehydrogenase PdxA [Gemmatimonadetes bacterium]|nr:4-hydroxythreonine-4-phosphate dehydrogenase PdxA [Gemmatimonadota bacterium]
MTAVSARVAITLGDPRGIGPEITAKVLADPPVEAEFVVVGPPDLIENLPAEKVPVGKGGKREEGRGKRKAASAPSSSAGTLGARGTLPSSLFPLPAVEAGRLAGLAVEKAAELALRGEVDAIVTGPVEKHALHLAGYRYPGHTEWLAVLAGGVDVAMMLASDRLRVVLVTTHIPLRDVPRALSTDRVVRTGRVTADALRCWWGIERPRLAVCAVNPHAGESGLFGAEDAEILAPAAAELGCAGPLPADTVFVRALKGEFDAVLAPYHDLGMTAIKVASFGKAVNVTLGLPFIRTSPDHGTAFDIAGEGMADPGSMREAVKLAVELVNKRGKREKGKGKGTARSPRGSDSVS